MNITKWPISRPRTRRHLNRRAPAFLSWRLSCSVCSQRPCALCNEEKSVSQMLTEIDTTQPNLSQHLNVLYRCGVLAKRKQGTQVIYRVQSEQAVTLCRSVCTQIAIEMDSPSDVPADKRLLARVF